LAVSPNPAGAANPKPVDWDAITREATVLLSKYIQINTTNPPGNEIAAAKFLKEKFLAEGIPAAVFESQPGRGIVAARLLGINKHNKTLILLSHMDVVPAEPTEWQQPPFSGLVKDGEIWGRGSLDDKGPGIVELMAMLAVKRTGITLNRDVLFLATADEEEGGRQGAGWVVDHQSDLIADAGFVLNEGGGIRVDKDGHDYYGVSTAEKAPLWVRLTAAGTSGHASAPPEQTAVTHLVRALNRLIDYVPPTKVVPPVQSYFRIMAQLGRRPAEFENLAKALKDPAFAKKFLYDPSQSAAVRDTITPTVLAGSLKINVIPAAASAEIDCRLLPGDDPNALLTKLRDVIADNTIKVDELLNFPSVSSPDKSALMTAIQTLAKTHDKAPVVPTMLNGFTDSHYFRQKGLVAYGFIPLEFGEAQGRTVHGANERIGIKSLRASIERMVDLLKIFGGRSSQ
jgi:acetylornithine deacetylase/succinyl-diaminopimelate desuccinylase-like protein